MRIPLVGSGRDDTPPSWWEWLFAPVMMPLFLVGLLVLAGLSVVAMPFLVFAMWRRERQFGRLIRDRGRFIPWMELEAHLRAGEGTLVVEQAQKDGVRVWWTQEDVVQKAPTQPPAEQDLDYLRFTVPHPFVSWCFERFLSPESGNALLTAPPYSYPPGFVEEAFFRDKFPKLRIVMTVKLA